KVFVARQNIAAQLVSLEVAPDAVLEYMPDPLVPCRGSRFFQRINVTADEGSTVILSETLLPGRVAHGERRDYDLYWSETEARRPDGSLLFADLVRLDPVYGAHPSSPGLLGPYDVFGSLHVLAGRVDSAELIGAVRSAITACGDIAAGVSELP